MLDSAFKDGKKALTLLQINKMVYISHGWILGAYGRPLIDNRINQIQAWKYGPVVVGLYHMLKSFGSTSISVFDFLGKIARSGGVYDVSLLPEQGNGKMHLPALEDLGKDHPEVAEGLEWLYGYYVRYSGEQLITLTHQRGSPWYEVYYDRNRTGILERWGLTSNGNIHIPDALIRSHYGSRVNKKDSEA